MTTATLTLSTDTAPAIVNVALELSGPLWCARFPGSNDTSTLTPAFRSNCDEFINAIRAAGGTVTPSSTYRPPERAYMMHYAHKIYRSGLNPASVPPMAGVNIRWVHPTPAASVDAARLMCAGFQILNLTATPSLNSRHTARKAIDMSIAWSGTLNIRAKDGTVTAITTLPRTGMNLQLKAVGLTYGVVKYHGGNADRPHWSVDGY